MKIIDCMQYFQAIGVLAKKPLPIKVSMKVVRNHDKMLPFLVQAEQERLALTQKLSADDLDFHREFANIVERDVDVVIEKFTLEELNSDQLSPEELDKVKILT